MPEISLTIAFVSGLLMFFSACLVPIVPIYISYISGVSIKELSNANKTNKKEFLEHRRRIILNSIFFVLGFSLIFILLGLSATAIGQFLNEKRHYLERGGGLFMIFLGIYLTGLVKIPFLYKEFKFRFKKNSLPLFLNSFLFGLAFGFSWTPCISPILSGILFMASLSQSIWQGGVLLAVFALGLAVPFLAMSFALVAGYSWISKFSKFFVIIKYFGSIVLIGIGILMLAGVWSEIVVKLFV